MIPRSSCARCAPAVALAAALLALGPALPAPPAAAATPSDSAAAVVRGALADSARRPATPAEALRDTDRRPSPLPPMRTRVPAGSVPPAAAASPEGPAVPGDISYMWRTRAERTGWRETADYEETMRFCRQLESGSRWIRLVTYGTSGQGRALPMLVVSRDRAFTPEAARATGKPIVLIQNGIHAGEIEGKDASLALVRDMAVLKSRESLLDSCIVLVLPIYSVDAHERRGHFNRMNQNGPAPTGWRTTPVGLNLNRDYMKAEAPETQALLSGVYTSWWPDLLVDDHTTDGADYQHDVTYAYAHGPAVPGPIDRWYETAFEGRVVPALARKGHLPAPYLSFRRGDQPLSGIDFGSTPPRFSTGYAPLQCRAAILVETHMLKPYGTRVQATYDLLVTLLEELRLHPAALTGAVREAEREVVARARATDPAARAVTLTGRTTDRSVPFAFRGRVTTWAPSEITGAPVAHYSSAPWDTIIPLFREVAPALSVRAPAGYVIPQEWSAAIALLQRHGVQVRRFARAWSDSVELYRIAEWNADREPYEGHHPLHVTGGGLERQWRTYRAGDAWVPLEQRAGLLAMHLCEAQAPDGLVTWNYFDTVLQPKEYGEPYVVEPLARDMLAKDPALAKAFAQKLASDSTFAANPFARSDFFYRRSKWADPEQNLVPVARALRAVPEAALAPLPGPAAPGAK
jgi:murein tripeptide amidase MpaA